MTRNPFPSPGFGSTHPEKFGEYFIQTNGIFDKDRTPVSPEDTFKIVKIRETEEAPPIYAYCLRWDKSSCIIDRNLKVIHELGREVFLDYAMSVGKIVEFWRDEVVGTEGIVSVHKANKLLFFTENERLIGDFCNVLRYDDIANPSFILVQREGAADHYEVLDVRGEVLLRTEKKEQAEFLIDVLKKG